MVACFWHFLSSLYIYIIIDIDKEKGIYTGGQTKKKKYKKRARRYETLSVYT